MAYGINKRVAYCRRALGFSQAKMAEMIGVKLSTYSQCEKNGNISAERLIKIAEALNIDVTLLLVGQKTQSIPPEPPIKDKKIIEDHEFKVSKKEIRIIQIYRDLSEIERKEVDKFVQKKLDKQRKRVL